MTRCCDLHSSTISVFFFKISSLVNNDQTDQFSIQIIIGKIVYSSSKAKQFTYLHESNKSIQNNQVGKMCTEEHESSKCYGNDNNYTSG